MTPSKREPIPNFLEEKLHACLEGEAGGIRRAALAALAGRLRARIERRDGRVTVSRITPEGDEQTVPAHEALERGWLRWGPAAPCLPLYAADPQAPEDLVLDGPDEELESVLEAAPAAARRRYQELSRPPAPEELPAELARLLGLAPRPPAAD